ncbi:endonuclease MutS2 [Saccharicrinis sp. FJH54]|uniref:endonuclease MutS2 n=1 Tax=Saccharicrinis sp. FJH54 TaxID=3344665 RepID=UPI0035D482D9
MIYPATLEDKIGFDRIRRMLKAECMTTLGEQLVDDVSYLTEIETIRFNLGLTWEFVIIRREEDSFEIGFFTDLREPLKSARPQGTWLSEKVLHELRKTLETLSHISGFFKGDRKEKYPYLSAVASEVLQFPDVIQKIKRVFDDEGRMKDNASPELLKIRQTLRQEQQTLSRRIQRVLVKAKTDGLIDSDVSPSVRDGRLVIPVEARNKRKIGGIIHDESATGKTAFIEPAEVVEANNRIRELEIEERREIVKILIELTAHIRPHFDEIGESFHFLGLIDFLRSKSILTGQLNAILPVVKDQQAFDWKEAVHPLLYLSFKREGKQVVPLSLRLNSANRILLISGPNAGGKSVCLKTVGLIQYMLQCGIPVPVHESSEMGIFEDIFIDIGDEQSLDNDLSTYSSHLLNMKHFLKNAGPGSLLLVDEFGTGTEPQIGGAIAESILQHINNTGAYGVLTTHYSNLKHYASQTQGIINGAMMFDQQHLQPLFQLQVGKPGSSYAIEMARKIGIPESVIELASEKVGQETMDFDKHLREILRDKTYWERKRDNIRKKNKQVEDLENTYKEQLQKIKGERSKILDEAKREAARLMDNANATIENTIRKIRESEADKLKTKDARHEFEEQKEQISGNASDDSVIKEMEKLLRRQERKMNKKPSPKAEKKKQGPEKEKINKGDTVRIISRNTFAEVLDIKGTQVDLALGHLRITVKLNELEKVSNREAKRSKKDNYKTSETFRNTDIQNRKLNFRSDIDVRGMRGEEAVRAVMNFVDDAVMVGATHLRILHGTGTGALRQMIREYLNTVEFVDSARDEHVQLGGVGITLVDLSY